MSDRQKWLHRLYQAIRVIVPVAILAVVFSRIDFHELGRTLALTNPWLLGLGLSLQLAFAVIGALRWRAVVLLYLGRRLPVNFALKQYWIGLAVGQFVPASVGTDIYRAAAAGRRFGGYAMNSVVVVTERVLGLLAVSSIAVVAYPFVRNHMVGTTTVVQQVMRIVVVFLCASVLGFVALSLALRSKATAARLERIGKTAEQALEKGWRVLGWGYREGRLRLPFREISEPLAKPGSALPVFLLSLSIPLLLALRDQVFFRSLGYEIPIGVNVFLVPIFTFVYALPISIGSLGVREGTSIVLYGLFGVPAETALLISTFGLAAILLNSAIGAALILVSRGRQTSALTAEGIPNAEADRTASDSEALC